MLAASHDLALFFELIRDTNPESNSPNSPTLLLE